MSRTITNMYLLRKLNKFVAKHMLDSKMKAFLFVDMWRFNIANLFTFGLKLKPFLLPSTRFCAKNLKCFLYCDKYVYG